MIPKMVRIVRVTGQLYKSLRIYDSVRNQTG